MADIIKLEKAYLRLGEAGDVVVFYKNKYGFEQSITVDKETAKTASISADAVSWGMYLLPFKEIVLSHVVAVPRVMGEPNLPKDALHLIYELIAEYYMKRITDVPINFNVIKERYAKCLGGMNPQEIYYKIPKKSQ